MTKATLREAVKQEARITSSNNLDDLIDSIILEILDDYCNKARYYELLSLNNILTLVAGQQAYDLPDDYQNMANARYGRGPSPTTFLSLTFQNQNIRQTYNGGNPFYYRLTGTKISLWPYTNVVVADQLVIDYYIKPSTLLVDEDDDFPVPRLESTVKKEAIARVQRFHAADQSSQMTSQDALGSFNASQSASG